MYCIYRWYDDAILESRLSRWRNLLWAAAFPTCAKQCSNLVLFGTGGVQVESIQVPSPAWEAAVSWAPLRSIIEKTSSKRVATLYQCEGTSDDGVTYSGVCRMTVLPWVFYGVLCLISQRGCTLSGWNRFLMSLNFDKPLEFNEGDIGLAGMSERHILSSWCIFDSTQFALHISFKGWNSCF